MSASLPAGLYTPQFCEENVYLLLRSAAVVDGLYAIVISNEQRTVFVDQQGTLPERSWVIWDYHVIAISSVKAYDYASRLPFGLDLLDYIEATWPPELVDRLLDAYVPVFRMIPAHDYLRYFASDRSHMLGSGCPFPPYPPIVNEAGETNTLFSHFLADMRSEALAVEGHGRVMSLEGLRSWAQSQRMTLPSDNSSVLLTEGGTSSS